MLKCRVFTLYFNIFYFYPKNPRFLTGGCSFIVFASCSNSFLCSPVNFFGIFTITVNIKSPCFVELGTLNPLSLIVNVVSFCVPAGIVYSTSPPSTNGIFRFAPRVAWVIVIGTSSWTLYPSLVKVLDFLTWTVT